MSDHPGEIHDGPDPEPVEGDTPLPVAELAFAKLAHPHLLANTTIPRDRIAWVQSIDHDRGVAVCAIRIPHIEIPLDALRRWER